MPTVNHATDDCVVLFQWDRQVYVTDVKDGSPSVDKAYDEIRQNFFIGNWYGQEAIDNDDGSCYYNTHHNFFVCDATTM